MASACHRRTVRGPRHLFLDTWRGVHSLILGPFTRLERHDEPPARPRRTDPRHGAADARRRERRRTRPADVHPLGGRPGAGRAGDQRRHRRGTAPDPRGEGAHPRGRPRDDGHPHRRRRGRAVHGRGRPPGDRVQGRRRRRLLGLPDPRLPERAARPTRSRRLPRGDCGGRTAADPVPAAAGARRAELRARHAAGDGVGRGRRRDQGGIVRRAAIRRHRSSARGPARARSRCSPGTTTSSSSRSSSAPRAL